MIYCDIHHVVFQWRDVDVGVCFTIIYLLETFDFVVAFNRININWSHTHFQTLLMIHTQHIWFWQQIEQTLFVKYYLNRMMNLANVQFFCWYNLQFYLVHLDLLVVMHFNDGLHYVTLKMLISDSLTSILWVIKWWSCRNSTDSSHAAEIYFILCRFTRIIQWTVAWSYWTLFENVFDIKQKINLFFHRCQHLSPIATWSMSKF